jgi:Ca-activated chloride channel family protein
LAREAVEQSLRMLRPQDRFTRRSDTEVDVIMPSTFAAGRHACRPWSTGEVHPRGARTCTPAGRRRVAGRPLTSECVNRVLLLTDGLANAGVTDRRRWSRRQQLRGEGGHEARSEWEDFDEQLLRDIALEGGGQSYFIESPAQISDLLTSELGEALEVVRRGVVLQVTLPPGAECALLNRYRHTLVHGDNELHVPLGDLTSGQELSLVVRLTFPEDREAHTRIVSRRQMRCHTVGRADVDIRQPCGGDAQPRDLVVDREVATLYAGRARADATQANRHGDFSAARLVLESTARRIREYARGDTVLESLWRDLMTEVQHYSRRRLSEKDHKMAFFAAEAQVRNRDGQGKAKRAPR